MSVKSLGAQLMDNEHVATDACAIERETLWALEGKGYRAVGRLNA